MKRALTIQILFVGVLIFSSCKREDSVNIDQQRIYTNYEYVYDAQSYQTTATVTFRVDNSNGTKIELTSPARVQFNGETLSWKNGSGAYQVTRPGSVIGGTFSYVDLDDKKYLNSTPELSYIELPYGLSTISKNGPFFLPWSGGPILAGESVTVTISGGAQSSSTTWTLHTVGANYIALDQYKLNQLIAGNAEVQIKREIVTGIQESTGAGGRMTATYRSQKAYVTITE